MNQFIKDVLKILLASIVVLGTGFGAGVLVGRNRPPTIRTIMLSDIADREYIERYHIAGEDGYSYILHKEYKMNAEFVIDDSPRLED